MNSVALKHPCPICTKREQGRSGFCEDCEVERTIERYLERELEERRARQEERARLQKEAS